MSSVARAAIAALALLLASCTPASIEETVGKLPGVRDAALQTHAVPSIKTVPVRRVAVMPIIEAPDVVDRDVAAGAGESMTALVYGQVMLAGGWDVVPEEDAQQAMSSLPPTSLAKMDQNALALGHQVSADKVLYGSVERYTERVGYSYAAASPASVTFTLRFVDLGTKQIIWSAKYAKTQKSLSQNVLHLPTFLQNEGRWVKAIDIASQGVSEAISDLHSRLNLMPKVKRFSVGGELR